MDTFFATNTNTDKMVHYLPLAPQSHFRRFYIKLLHINTLEEQTTSEWVQCRCERLEEVAHWEYNHRAVQTSLNTQGNHKLTAKWKLEHSTFTPQCNRYYRYSIQLVYSKLYKHTWAYINIIIKLTACVTSITGALSSRPLYACLVCSDTSDQSLSRLMVGHQYLCFVK